MEVDNNGNAVDAPISCGNPMMAGGCMPCRDMYDDSMPLHMRQASYAAAAAISMGFHSGASMMHPRMAQHAAMLSQGLHGDDVRRGAEPMMPRMSGPPECAYGPFSESMPPLAPPPSQFESCKELTEGQKAAWSAEFNALLAHAEGVPHKRPLPVFELDDPLCLTPPMAPITSGANSQCLSPFELDEKRPSKLARTSEVPLKPEPLRVLPEMLGGAPEELSYRSEPVIPLTETEYFDFFEALLAM